MLMAAGFNLDRKYGCTKLDFFLLFKFAIDKDLLPKMVSLVEKMHEKDIRKNQMYFRLQECIQNHYKAQGSCLFFKDSKEIMNGVKPFDVDDAIEKVTAKMQKCAERFGVPTKFKKF